MSASGSSILGSFDVADISPAVAIEIEVEEAIASGDHMTNEELLAWSERLLRGDLDVEAEEAKAKAAILAKHSEYQRVKAELGRQLGLKPGDIHPLDIDLDQKWEGYPPNDPRIKAWKRALKLLHQRSNAH